MSLPGATAATGRIPTRDRPNLLRITLTLDAAVTGLNGVAYLVGASLLDDFFGLDVGLLRGVGAFLLAYGVVVWVVGTRPRISRTATRAIIAVNAAWTVASVAVAASGWGAPSITGVVWIVLQAVVVGAFCAVQWIGLQRSQR